MYGFSINVDGNSVAQMKAIEAQLTSMGVKAQIETKEVGSAFAGMGEKIQGALGGIKNLLIGGFGIGALMEGFSFIKESKEAFDKLESSVAQVNASLASTKGVAGMAFEDVNKSAKELSANTLFGRSSILDMQSVLLTFPSVTKDVFPSASAAILDMATKLKTGPTEAAIQLGKALQDPEKGITALHRVGVNTDELKKKFETVTDTLQRQKLIIAELNTEFGGSAKAAANTDEGKIEMAKKQWGSIKLEIGEIVSKIQVDLIPLFTVFISGLKKGVEIGKELKEWFTGVSKSALAFKSVLIAIGGYYTYIGVQAAIAAAKTGLLAISNWYAAAGFSAEAAAAEIFTGNMWGLNAAMDANPVGLIIAGLTALGVAFYIAWQKSDTFRAGMKGLWEAIKVFGEAIADVFIGIKKILSGDFTEGIVQLTNSFSGAGAKAGDAFRTAFDREMLKSTTDAFNIEFDKKLEALNKKKEDGKIKDEDYKKELVVLQKEAQNANLHGKLSGAGLTLDTDKLRDILHPKKFAGVNGGGTGLKDSAINTSNLSGASGGLGQAKVINIKIDTVQKIYGVVSKDLKSKGQDAAEMIIRTANNMQGGQSM